MTIIEGVGGQSPIYIYIYIKKEMSVHMFVLPFWPNPCMDFLKVCMIIVFDPT